MVSSFDSTVYVTTRELLEHVKAEFNVVVDQRTVSAWCARETDPLRPALDAKRGQSRRFIWSDARAWVARELARPLTVADLETADWHSARTISARERAKRDIIETRRLEGKYGDILAMEQTAEDRARQAVNLLMAIPSRLAPRLALMTDELAIDRLLDAEIRSVCLEIERSAAQDLAELDDDEPQEEPSLC